MSRRKDIDPVEIISDLSDYIDQYRIASANLEGAENLFVPRCQVRGQLVEFALKYYLAACGTYETGHDLNGLLGKAETSGLTVSDYDRVHVVEELHKDYCAHPELGWSYFSRYPMPNRPTKIWITPGHEDVDAFVMRVMNQASAKRQGA